MHGDQVKLDPTLLKPIERSDGRRTAVEVYDTLQNSILSGRLKPGTILSQVEVARALHVSRTPVREAMRMLQEGGLVTGEPNFRSRVLAFDPQDIEALYMKRIVMEAFGVSMTTQRMTPELRSELARVVAELEGEEAHQEFARWQALHRELHRLIVVEAGEAYVADLEALEKRSERYQSAYKGEHLPGWWLRGEQEHRALFSAMMAGDAAQAGELSARHLARTALELLAALAPEYDTSKVRMSLKFAIVGAGAGEI
jgi:DNA-binding GntR family transcriptional regulator